MHIVAGTHKRKKLYSLEGTSVRPTSSRLREALFNICQTKIEGATFLDLFSGVGAIGLEAVSRGASMVTFVEKGKKPFHLIEKNIALLGCQRNTHCFHGDVLDVLEKRLANQSFDLIYIDPPYGLLKGKRLYVDVLLEYIEQNNLLSEGGDIFIEEGTPTLSPQLEKLEAKECRSYGHSFLHHYYLNT